ncbi:MAG: acyl carrier protein [Caldimonas sp.]
MPAIASPVAAAPSTYDAIAEVLGDAFKVEPARISPEATLESLGLDSLALMEFVFAMEDRFDARIPEERLDPRQAGVTLATLAALIDDAVRTRATSPSALPAASTSASTSPAATPTSAQPAESRSAAADDADTR